MQLGLNQMGSTAGLVRLINSTFWEEEAIAPHHYENSPSFRNTKGWNQFFRLNTPGEETILAFLESSRFEFAKHPYLKVGNSPYYRLFPTNTRYQRDPMGLPRQTNLGRPEHADAGLFYFDRFAQMGVKGGGFTRGLLGVHTAMRLLDRGRMAEFDSAYFLATQGPEISIVDDYDPQTIRAFQRGYDWYVATQIKTESEDYARLSAEIFSQEILLTA